MKQPEYKAPTYAEAHRWVGSIVAAADEVSLNLRVVDISMSEARATELVLDIIALATVFPQLDKDKVGPFLQAIACSRLSGKANPFPKFPTE